MFKILVLPESKKDIREAAKWYNKQQRGLGKKFTVEIRDKVKFIQQNPEASSIRYNKIRTAVLSRFPFMIHYTINEQNKTIIIIAVLHTRLNPEIWKSR